MDQAPKNLCVIWLCGLYTEVCSLDWKVRQRISICRFILPSLHLVCSQVFRKAQTHGDIQELWTEITNAPLEMLQPLSLCLYVQVSVLFWLILEWKTSYIYTHTFSVYTQCYFPASTATNSVTVCYHIHLCFPDPADNVWKQEMVWFSALSWRITSTPLAVLFNDKPLQPSASEITVETKGCRVRDVDFITSSGWVGNISTNNYCACVH